MQLVSNLLDILLFFASIFLLIFLGACSVQYLLNVVQDDCKKKVFIIFGIYYYVCCLYLIVTAGENI